MPSHVIADLLTLNTVLYVYSTVYSTRTLSLSPELSPFCLIWCQINRPWSKFTIRLFFAPFRPGYAISSPNSRRRQRKNKNSAQIIGFYLDSSQPMWRRKANGQRQPASAYIGECKCPPPFVLYIARTRKTVVVVVVAGVGCGTLTERVGGGGKRREGGGD